MPREVMDAPGSVQGWAGWTSEQPGQAGVPAHGREVEQYLPNKTILCFCDIYDFQGQVRVLKFKKLYSSLSSIKFY